MDSTKLINLAQSANAITDSIEKSEISQCLEVNETEENLSCTNPSGAAHKYKLQLFQNLYRIGKKMRTQTHLTGLKKLLIVLSTLISSQAIATTQSLTLVWGDVAHADHFRLEEQAKLSDSEWSDWTYIEPSERLSHSMEKEYGDYRYRVIGCVVDPTAPDTPLCDEVAEYSDTFPYTAGASLSTEGVEFPGAPKAFINLSALTEQSASTKIGTLAGQFRVDESGGASYSIPIDAPPGIGGIAPDVSLNYSSNSGNGAMGMGWSVGGLSAISRCRKTFEQEGENGAIKFDAEDRFCLDGQKLVAVSGVYGANSTVYRTEIDNMSRIISHGNAGNGPNYFSVERPDGSLSRYGFTSDSVLATGDDSVITWLLSDSKDNLDNTVSYAYDNSSYGSNEIHISSISYSGHSINFAYNQNIPENQTEIARTDVTSGYVLGEVTELTARLDSVTTNFHGGASISHNLEYRKEANTGLTQLTSIEKCAGTTCLPKTQFSWEDVDATGIYSQITTEENDDFIVGTAPADIDGNGVSDLVYMTTSDARTYKIKVKYNNRPEAPGFTEATTIHTFISDEESTLKAADVDSDGKVELVFKDDNNWRYFDFNNSIESVVANRNFSGEPDLGTITVRVFSLAGLTTSEVGRINDLFFFDVDGDALTDIVYAASLQKFSGTIKVIKSLGQNDSGQNQWAAASPADLTGLADRDTEVPEGFYKTVSNLSMLQVSGAYDFNGDGISDLLLRSKEDFTSTEYECDNGGNCSPEDYYSEGYLAAFVYMDGEYQFLSYTSDTALPTISSANSYAIGDLNADGYSDVVTLNTVSYGTGEGFAPRQSLNIGDSGNGYVFSPTIADMNRDGQPDLVYFSTSDSTWYALYQTNGSFTEKQKIFGPISNYEAGKDSNFVAEWEGDSTLDFTFFDTSEQKIRIYADRNNKGVPANLINKVTNGFGLETVIDYSTLLDSEVYTKGSGADMIDDFGAGSPVFDLISPSYVVKKVSSSAPVHDGTEYDTLNTVNVQYHYEAMRAQAGGRGMLGFKTISTFDEQQNVTTQSSYRQDFPFIGMPDSTIKYIGNRVANPLDDAQLLSYATNEYASIGLKSDSIVYPYLDLSTEEQFSLNNAGTATTPISTVTTDNTYSVFSDNHANLSNVVVTTKDASGSVASTITTVNTYTDDDVDTKWWLGRVSTSSVTHNRADVYPVDAMAVERNSKFEYFPINTLHEGMLKYEIVQYDSTDSAEKLTTLHCYDDFGNEENTYTYSNHFTADCPTAGSPVTILDTSADPLKVFRHSFVNFDASGRYPTDSGTTFYGATGNQTLTSNTVLGRGTFGQPTQVRDINGVVTQSKFDAFGAPFASANSLGGLTETQRRLYSQRSQIGAPAIEDFQAAYFVQRSTAAGKPVTYLYFDKLGQQIATVTAGFDDDEWLHQYVRYDELGRMAKSSIPKKVNGPGMAIIDWNNEATTTSYDQIGRVDRIESDAMNTLSVVTYNGLSTTTLTTSSDGHGVSQSRIETKSVLGDTTSLQDNSGVVTYNYSHTGNLTRVVGVEGTEASEVTTTFDDLGRKIAMSDPDKGNWAYTYNAVGEMATQTDQNGNKTTLYRDNLGRTIKRNVQVGTTDLENTGFVYNGHQLRKECQLTDSVCSSTQPEKQYFYDSLGRVELVSTILDNQTFTQQTTYDHLGRVFQQFDAERYNPLGCVANGSVISGAACHGIKFNYSSSGYLLSQEEARTSGTAEKRVVYYQVEKMDAFGNVETFVQNAQDNTNKLETTKDYDNKTGYLDSIITKNIADDNLVHINYDFDAIGNLRSRNNISSGYDETFGYDPSYRLQSMTGSPIANNVSVTYTANGNIKTKSDVESGATYVYGTQANGCAVTAGIHAVSSVGNRRFCYDGNGNQTHAYDDTGLTRQIVYSHFDKPTLIDNKAGNAKTRFAYDNNRNRFKRVDEQGGVTTTTYYVGNLEFVSKSDGSSEEVRRYLPDAIQTIKGAGESTLKFLHKDHLGSIDTITTVQGKIEEKLYFDPWGGKHRLTVFSSWSAEARGLRTNQLSDILNTTPRGFTGHEHIDHANIIHMNGRIYDPTLGRFLQADPHIQAPMNSQNYNRYSYVLNNPLSYTDPSGYFFNKLFKKINKALGKFAPVFGIALMFIPGMQAWAAQSMWHAAAVGFGIGGVSTGSLKGALIGAFSGAVFHQLGTHFGDKFGKFADATLGQQMQWAGSHALAGGVISSLSGGKFGHGFFSAGFSKFAMGNAGFNYDDVSAGAIAERTAIAAIIGGTASAISGGKFANGAQTAAMAQLFNAEVSNNRRLNAAQKRAELAAAALKSDGDTSYAKAVRKGRFAAGAWKCNQFVADKLSEVGLSPIMLSEGSPEFMTANGWANKNHHIPGWEIVDTPMPGDVAAIPRSGGSGHVGIYVEDRGYFRSSVMAANEMGVGWSGSHLRNNYVNSWAGANGDTVYRRYVGGN